MSEAGQHDLSKTGREHALHTLEEILHSYERERKDGEIIIEIRGGRPIWVKQWIELRKHRVG